MRTVKPIFLAIFLATAGAPAELTAATSQLLGWNNLGMHCMDSDYSVFSILPPYNTIEAQLIVGGKLIRDGAGYRVTYEAIADATGSINSAATGKGNFYDHAASLYGVTLAPEMGLAGWAMPGLTNTPQSMLFETTNHPAATVATRVDWWRAEGIPISPYDDAGRKNPYPLMRLMAWNSAGQPVATNDIALPVSDEMDCSACHASGSQAAAEPAAGWVWDGVPERDYRLNILRLHDERQFAGQPAAYGAALAGRGFNLQGLYRGVVAAGKPVLCASCHASEALGLGSYGTTPPLTTSVHSYHAHVMDPDLQVTLDSAVNRAACYRCHPGSATRCLRGAMGRAVALDGSRQMQCQSCHGTMSAVGSTNRVGWFMEPNCQSCHTATALKNNGQIRFTSAFEADGTPRIAVDSTFATQPDTPAPGISLYRFSSGHGGLQCSACHGSTHAEFPSAEPNDNLRNLALQGHAGVVSECTACHPSTPNTVSGGPHGLHPIGQAWVGRHPDIVESGGRSQCAACHGSDYRGTVLSRALADRSLTVRLEDSGGSLTLARGALIGCYTCHNGPNSESANPTPAPTVNNVSLSTTGGQLAIAAVTVNPSSASLRILTQPDHGTVGLSNNLVTYYPEPGYVGADTFTYMAWNNAKNSGPGLGTVSVASGAFSLEAVPFVPPSYPAGWAVPFGVDLVRSNTQAPVNVTWNFGDDSAADTNRISTHVYAAPGIYTWSLVASAGEVSVHKSGSLEIGPAVILSAIATKGAALLSWPRARGDSWLESTPILGPAARWTVVTNDVNTSPEWLHVTVPAISNQFFRVRRSW